MEILVVGGLVVGGLSLFSELLMPTCTHDPTIPACRNQLKALALALHNYHDDFHCFPPAYVADESGRRMHSWRILILPYLDEGKALHAQYDFSQPWDSAANRRVLESMPEVYRYPSRPRSADTFTCFCAVCGPGTMFPGSDSTTIRDARDGSSRTLILGEVSDAKIPWTAPYDIDVAAHPKLGDPIGFSSRYKKKDRVLFAFVDGGARTFDPAKVDAATLRGLFQRDDGGPATDW